MVVDLPDFAQWTGATPFAELRKLDAARAKRFADRTTTLHYWGQFTDQLPPPFQAEGGHQYLRFETEAEARKKLAELRKAVEAKFPNVEVEVDDEQTQFTLPDDGGGMVAELSPKSEYDASWQANEEADCWTHSFGTDGKATALFWEMEGDGSADVAVADDGATLVLVRSWLSGEDETENAETEAVRALVTSGESVERPGGEIVIASGKAAIVWSPIAAFQLDGVESPEALLALGDKGPASLDIEEMSGVGLVLKLKPGRYTVTFGSTDPESDDEGEDEEDEDEDGEEDEDDREWSCRWCRLTWAG